MDAAGCALCLVCMAPARLQPPPGGRRGFAAEPTLLPPLCITSRLSPDTPARPPARSASAGAAPQQVVNSLVDLCCGKECFERMQNSTWAPALRNALFELERGVCQVRERPLPRESDLEARSAAQALNLPPPLPHRCASSTPTRSRSACSR